jgi:hypothetical protein
VMLHLPGEIDAESVSELHLIESFLKQALLGAVAPRARELVLVKDSELHYDASPPATVLTESPSLALSGASSTTPRHDATLDELGAARLELARARLAAMDVPTTPVIQRNSISA